jgi:hypothetical protein
MELPELALRGTIWLSLLAWVVGEWQRSLGLEAARRGRGAWTIGALAAVLHSALAFQLRHGWSHGAAYADTARQTAAVTGLDWGGGLFVNYLFLAVWTADALWWWMAPDSFRRRARLLDRSVRGFLWFMFLNGAVVFARGWMRGLGAAAVLAVAAAWYRRACCLAGRSTTAG